jgi:hypothetical protein
MLDSLLGPSDAEPDLTRLCDIIFPDAEVTTFVFEFELTGSDDPRSLLVGKRGALKSVGVGGVFTIVGATSTAVGGVDGGRPMSTVVIFAVLGRSGVDVGGGTGGTWTGTVCDLSGNKFPSLDETLLRLLMLSNPSDDDDPPPAEPLNFLSGLVLGLELFFVFNASRSLPTGDGDLLCDPFSGARSEGVESDVASLLIEAGRMLVRGACTPSSDAIGSDVVWTRGEEEVR